VSEPKRQTGQQPAGEQRKLSIKSGKQRRAELDPRRKQRAAKIGAERAEKEQAARVRNAGGVPVNRDALAKNNSYGEPDFSARGYYLDRPFECVDCGKSEVWTAAQQKWWYEVAKGYAYSLANRCRACRRRERERRAEARRNHLSGLAKKHAAKDKQE
jgi:hypothetical protein